MIKRFLQAFVSDLLYDLYQVKQGKLNLFRDVILHYFVIWGGGFFIIHVFLFICLYFLFVIPMEFYQFIIGMIIILITIVLMWVFAGKLYGEHPDRPIVEGINDKSKLPRWLR